MTRALPRTHFNRSSLVRILADLALLDPLEGGGAFAEKLGLWVDFMSANTLSAALAAIAASATGPQSLVPSDTSAPVVEAFDRARLALVNSIGKSFAHEAAASRAELGFAKPGKPFAVAAAYAPHRRNYLAHQRDMDLRIRPLRVNVREVLATSSPALKKLAVLDATLESILGDRESKLLATLASLLEKRFEQLFTAHQQALVDAQQADSPGAWMKPGGWLARFGNELQTVLLAELDLRLQPIVGLLEALHNEKTKYQ